MAATTKTPEVADNPAPPKKKTGRPPGSKDKQKRVVTDAMIEQRRNNGKDFNSFDTPEGYNAKYIKFMLEITPTEPLDRNDVEEMERRFYHYLETCAKYDMKVGNLAAYNAIGISKNDAVEWERNPKANPARSGFAKKLRQMCAMYREGLMSDGKVNPVTGIFWQKNYDGFRDQTEMVVTPGNQNDDYKSAEQLEKKYLEASEVGTLPAIETTAEEVD